MKWVGRRKKTDWSKKSLGMAETESGWEALSRRIASRSDEIPPHPEWLLDQAAENVRLGAPAALADKVAKIAAGRGATVVTGQQVALMGGPLYSVYKLMSAVALAKELEEVHNLPVLPVFWSVSDDADFGEVSSTWLARPEGRLIKLRDEGVPPGGTRIGTLSSERQMKALKEQEELILRFPRGKEVLDRLGRIETRTENWQQFQTTLFHLLLPETSFLVLDGGDPALLELVDPWLRRMGRTEPLRRDLEAGAQVATALDIGPSFEPDLAERALFRIEGDLRLPIEGSPELASEPLAPNVVLRPLLQDYILPNVATICGPSEIRYRVQLSPVYEKRNVPEPLRVPRMSATLSPPLESNRLQGDLGGYEVALRDPKAFVQSQIESATPPALVGELVEMREEVRTRMASWESELDGIDKSLRSLVDSAGGKADYQFERILDGIRGKLRQALLRNEPSLASFADWVKPRDREQERVLSALVPILLEGWGALAPMQAVALENLRPILDGTASSCDEVFVLDNFI